MVKISGAQTIPAEWLDEYRAALAEKLPDGGVRKRYPYRMPRMQEGGRGVKPAQLIQRERFKTAIANFADLSSAERSRWFANEPPWSSFLWYYNYFIMSSLAGNANINQGGAGVIKLIQLAQASIGTGGGYITFGTAIDIAKAVVMVWGAGYSALEQEGVAHAWNVYPIPDTLETLRAHIAWSTPPIDGATIAIQVIEYI